MRTISLIVFIIIFNIFVSGQEKKEFDSLKIDFKIKSQSLCFGDSVNITANLINTSKKLVIVDVNLIGSIKYFDRFINKSKKDLSIEIEPDIFPSKHYKPNFIILQPMETYTKNLIFVFNDNFFNRPANYQMQIGYEKSVKTKYEGINIWTGIIYSNTVNLSIKKCEIK